MKWLLALVALPLSAHVMSMSTGDATIASNRLDYILRMPFYEVEQLPHPEISLLQHIRFEGARLQNQKCFRDGESYVCAADYLFDRPIDTLEVSCTLFAVTVPNHVHVLRAHKDGKQDQAFFDYTFTNSTLRFTPPTKLGTAARGIASGAVRGVGGFIQVLFLFTLGLAARNRKELLALIAAFAAGLVAGATIAWHPNPRFAECTAAIGIAYLAVEILFVPLGRWRWLIAAVLGTFQGLYLSLFITGETLYFLTGAALAAAATCAILGLLMLGRIHRLAAAVPLAAALFWFFTRLQR